MPASVEALVQASPCLSTRPQTMATLLDVLDDPVVEADRLLPIVETDPGLTARLLKLCNSPLYGLSRRVGSVKEALVRVGNRAFVLVGGQRRPVLGRVTMNFMCVGLGPGVEVAEGDEVVLLGTQGKESLWADELGRWDDTISYEVLTNIRTDDRRTLNGGAR